MGENKQKILVIEDNPADVHLLQIALEAVGVQAELEHAADGEEGVKMVRHINGCRPNLIVLDLNLPKLQGDEVLRHIRVQPTSQRIPVVVLTSSDTDEDRCRMVKLGANAFLTKGYHLSDYLKVGTVVKDMLMSGASLPS